MNPQRLPVVLIAALIAALVVLLLGSWLWFYNSQQETRRQLAVLAAQQQAGGGSARAGGPSKDPYKDEAVRNTIRKSAQAVQQLWLAYLAASPRLSEGVVEVDWQIDADGKVLEAALVHSDFGNRALEQGIVKIVQGLRFPPPPQGARTYIAHKFRFRTESTGQPQKTN